MITSKTLQYFYQQHVFCCINNRDPSDKRGCCASKGAQDLQQYMKIKCKEEGLKDIRINTSGCLNRCELGPVMVIYPQGVWYHYNSREDIDLIVEQHLSKGNIIEELRLETTQKKL
jgi:(2Fe-2S) ferredoxin